jgi:lipid II:glycine glycyltransferase (peptidoglycan interpeptide bridge formation enzyme)
LAARGDTGVALAQVLYRRRAGVSIGYLPRGPVMPGDDARAEAALWREIDRSARRRRAQTLIVETDRALPDEALRRLRLSAGPEPIQPSRSVKVPLLDDESLLAQMHAKTRYNVRMAKRRGVVSRVIPATEEAVSTFYGLLRDTAARNQFEVHAVAYYREFLRLFGDDAVLIFAEVESKPVAAVVSAAFGDEAIYMYGASSTKDRAHGAAFLIQHDAMRWARSRGCGRYDMWGIPAQDPESSSSESGDRLASSQGSDWRGIYEFKTRFGGEIVEYQPPLERRYHPLLASLARRFYQAGG